MEKMKIIIIFMTLLLILVTVGLVAAEEISVPEIKMTNNMMDKLLCCNDQLDCEVDYSSASEFGISYINSKRQILMNQCDYFNTEGNQEFLDCDSMSVSKLECQRNCIWGNSTCSGDDKYAFYIIPRSPVPSHPCYCTVKKGSFDQTWCDESFIIPSNLTVAMCSLRKDMYVNSAGDVKRSDQILGNQRIPNENINKRQNGFETVPQEFCQGWLENERTSVKISCSTKTTKTGQVMLKNLVKHFVMDDFTKMIDIGELCKTNGVMKIDLKLVSSGNSVSNFDVHCGNSENDKIESSYWSYMKSIELSTTYYSMCIFIAAIILSSLLWRFGIFYLLFCIITLPFRILWDCTSLGKKKTGKRVSKVINKVKNVSGKTMNYIFPGKKHPVDVESPKPEKRISIMSSEADPEDQLESIEKVLSKLREEQNKKFNSRALSSSNPSYFATTTQFIILALFLPLIFAELSYDQCDLTFYQRGESFAICTEGVDSLISCKTFANGVVTLPFLNSAACFSYQTDGYGIIGNLQIAYTDHSTSVQLNSQYYSSTYVVFVAATKRCYKAGTCPGNCATMQASNVDADGEISNPMTKKYPGKTSCMRTAGCAGNGCFYCDDGCLYTRYAFMPTTDKQVLVKYPVLIEDTPTIRVRYTDIKGETIMKYISSVGLNIKTDGFLFNILGNFKSSIALFSDNKIIVSQTSSDVWFAGASPVNQPSSQHIGDIQSNDLVSLVDPNPTSFLFADNIVSVLPQVSSASFTFDRNGILALDSAPKFPLYLGSDKWEYDNGRIKTKPNAPGALQVGFNLGVMLFSQTYRPICPKLTAVNNLQGCTSCPLGSTLSLVARGACNSGLIIITVKALVATTGYGYSVYDVTGTPTVPVSMADFNFTISINLKGTDFLGAYAKASSVVFLVTSADQSVSTQPITSKLPEGITVVSNNFTTVSPDPGRNSSGFTLDVNAGLSDGGTLYYIVIAAIVVGSIVVVVIIILIIFYFVSKTKIPRNKNYKPNLQNNIKKVIYKPEEAPFLLRDEFNGMWQKDAIKGS